MDEVVRDDKGQFTKAMCQYLERGEYFRNIAVRIKEPISQYDGRWVVQKDGIFTKTRFSLLMATMHSPGDFFRTEIGAAMVDRCIPLYFMESVQERREFHNPYSKRPPLFSDLGFNPESKIRIPFEDYSKIYGFWAENDREANRRTLGNMMRVFAVKGKHDEQMYYELIRLSNPIVKRVPRRRH
jgi:hypothetical protein